MPYVNAVRAKEIDDPDKEEDAYSEWQNRINVLNDMIEMIDAIDSQME